MKTEDSKQNFSLLRNTAGGGDRRKRGRGPEFCRFVYPYPVVLALVIGLVYAGCPLLPRESYSIPGYGPGGNGGGSPPMSQPPEIQPEIPPHIDEETPPPPDNGEGPVEIPPTDGDTNPDVPSVSGDNDGDGMEDKWEEENDAHNPTDDPDGDGLDNKGEFDNGTDPHNPDTDGDGLPDGWETDHGLDPLNPGDAGGDPDGDGLTNTGEYEKGTDPHKSDTDDDGWNDKDDPWPLDPDHDKDGMPDGWEKDHGLDPGNPDDGYLDPDGDGLSNKGEFDKGTDPNNADTDGDGMPDGWETANGLDPLVNDAGGDPDGDNLSNLAEYTYTAKSLAAIRLRSTDPRNPDTDGDKYPDGYEANIRYSDALDPMDPGTNTTDTDRDGMPDEWEDSYGLNPNDPADAALDPDGDGLSNKEEYEKGTNPHNPDTDGDGWGDGADPWPTEWDHDGDGIPDGWEKDHGLDPDNKNDGGLDPDKDGLTNREEYDHRTDPQKADTDGDGIPDGWETDRNLDPLNREDGALDPDGDGLNNKEEYDHGTNPQKADTDGDGMPDGWETANGLDPLVNDAGGDPDNDGLTNLREYNYTSTSPAAIRPKSTNPKQADTDGDGYKDGEEVTKNWDPLDPKNPHPERIQEGFYVSSLGNDTNPGTYERPLLKLSTAVAKAATDPVVSKRKVIVIGSLDQRSYTEDNWNHFAIPETANREVTITGIENAILLGGKSGNARRVVGIFENTKLRLENLTITGGRSEEGAGVYVSDTSTLTLGTGAVISGNIAKNQGGGVAVYDRKPKAASPSLILENGSVIRDNEAQKASDGGTGGGGVFCYQADMVMYPGSTISGNKSSNDGGGVFLAGGIFTMYGGTISGNQAYENGGGINIDERTLDLWPVRFYMKGGEIGGNIARPYDAEAAHGVLSPRGGGISFERLLKVTPVPGSGSGPSVENNGCGIYIEGGTVWGSNNSDKANKAEKNAWAIWVEKGSKVYNETITAPWTFELP
ncbi:MAG: hypothetical protein LBQ38_11560 [Spirochaetaceae bacterium]|nr:hypothetical protein [Spirochaetaceae bacterium]